MLLSILIIYSTSIFAKNDAQKCLRANQKLLEIQKNIDRYDKERTVLKAKLELYEVEKDKLKKVSDLFIEYQKLTVQKNVATTKYYTYSNLHRKQLTVIFDIEGCKPLIPNSDL